MATANQDPANIGFPMAQVVNFTTTNLDNGSVFTEPHTVSGPTGSFNIPLNAINIGNNKIVVPLTADSSPGANYLKFHLPQPGSSEFYVTFCQKNLSYSDGYYDYQTGIPSQYRTDLRNWIADNPTSIPPQGASYVKTLNFIVYGIDTNQVSSSIPYTVTFAATFGGTGGGVRQTRTIA